ncbi:hypothetical protein WJX77_007206 [Trebouxia sp. C0004]
MQRAPAQFAERGTTLTQRPETRASRGIADRAKLQTVDDFAIARTNQQSAEGLGSARRRSARDATRQQTAASDLTAAPQPTTTRQAARSAQTQQCRAATSTGAPAKRTNAETESPQQQYRPSSNTTTGRRGVGTEAKARLRNQASRRPATSGNPGDTLSSHQAPSKKQKVSRDLPDVQAGIGSLPSASNAALQLTGKQRASLHGATSTLPSQVNSAKSADASQVSSVLALEAEATQPCTSQDNGITSDSRHLPSPEQNPHSSLRDAAKHAQRDDPHLDRQPTGSEPPSTSDTQGQAAPKPRRQRTEGMLHPTFLGVKTSTQGVTHHVVHEAVKQVWSAFLQVPCSAANRKTKLLFLGKNYWTPEAAARAVDRASIALRGRTRAKTNFPIDWYGPEEKQRRGQNLTTWLSSLAGMRNNNPKNAPGVPHISWTPAITAWRLAHCEKMALARAQGKKSAGEGAASSTTIDPEFTRQLWEKVTGISVSQAENAGLQTSNVAWHRRVCGHCTRCKKVAWEKRSTGCYRKRKPPECVFLPKLEAARKRLSKLAKQSSQQRFAPADLSAFVASLPDTQEDLHVSPSAPLQAPQSPSINLNDDLDQFSHPGDGSKPTGQPRGLQSRADVSGVPREGRGGARVKGAMQGLRAVDMKHKGPTPDGQSEVLPEPSPASSPLTEGGRTPKPGKGPPKRSMKKELGVDVVAWTDAAVSALQVREDALFSLQEQQRVLAADAALHQGSYQPLLAAAPPAVGSKARFRWPDHHAADLRHIDRCAKAGKLVEVRNHDWWGAPALGTLGPPGAALQGSLGPHPGQRQARRGGCQWCKADDHFIKDCPLNAYFGEHSSTGPQQQEAKRKGKAAGQTSTADPSCKAAPAEWLSEVSEPVKGVMSAMQQMASLAVQSNEQKDSSHARLVQSMTPDALLACGLLVDELMKAQLETQAAPPLAASAQAADTT